MQSNPKRSRVALVFLSCSRQVIIASVWPWRAACVEFALWGIFSCPCIHRGDESVFSRPPISSCPAMTLWAAPFAHLRKVCLTGPQSNSVCCITYGSSVHFPSISGIFRRSKEGSARMLQDAMFEYLTIPRRTPEMRSWVNWWLSLTDERVYALWSGRLWTHSAGLRTGPHCWRHFRPSSLYLLGCHPTGRLNSG